MYVAPNITWHILGKLFPQKRKEKEKEHHHATYFGANRVNM
jgi:hypothetical protein